MEENTAKGTSDVVKIEPGKQGSSSDNFELLFLIVKVK